jgi:hypothetical protein
MAFLSKLGDIERQNQDAMHQFFVASELVSDVEGFIPASSLCGLRSKTGGPNKSVHRRGRGVRRE